MVDINDLDQTEYKIIDLKSSTEYIVYLLAVTIVNGNSIFVEDSTTALAGQLLPVNVMCVICFIDVALILLLLFYCVT